MSTLWHELAHSLHLDSNPMLVSVLTLALIFGLGLFAQILSDKTELPAIVYLLGFGALLGQDGLHLLSPDIFGEKGLRAMIAVAVALVVFEGGLMLDIKFFLHHWRSVLGLVTLNVFITLVGMAWVTHIILDIPWSLALLYSALVSVTGPTVIAPILRRLNISHKVKVILESEAVAVDAVGVIVAVTIFNFILVAGSTAQSMSTGQILKDILLSLVVGGACGAVSALCAYRIAKYFQPFRSEVARLLVLFCALLAYCLGEVLAHESGIAAVAVAGFMVGNLDFPYKNSIKLFKSTLTLFSITLVFLLLAASLELQFMTQMGLRGALCVFILMLVVRPVGVYLSTIFEQISWRERLFIAGLGPRGIVAASAATFFALELDAAGIEGGNVIRGMVFMTVLLTVIIQGSGAKYMAKLLNIAPDSTLVVGAGTIGLQLIEQLVADGKEGIIVIEQDTQVVERLQHLAHQGVFFLNEDARKEELYTHTLQSLERIQQVISTTDDDWLNLRVCQIAKKLNPNCQILSILNDVKGREVFANLNIQTINLREAAATLIHVMLEQAAADGEIENNIENAKKTGRLHHQSKKLNPPSH